jgi:hypothetical protein
MVCIHMTQREFCLHCLRAELERTAQELYAADDECAFYKNELNNVIMAMERLRAHNVRLQEELKEALQEGMENVEKRAFGAGEEAV